MFQPIEDCQNGSSLEFSLTLMLIMQLEISPIFSLDIPSYRRFFSNCARLCNLTGREEWHYHVLALPTTRDIPKEVAYDILITGRTMT